MKKEKELTFWITLQWFAAEDEGKTEEPTEQKLKDTREEGKVIRSQEFAGALALLVPFCVIFFFSSSILEDLKDLVVIYFSRITEWDITQNYLAVGHIFTHFLKITWFILFFTFLVVLLSNLAQVGIVFTTKPLNFKLEKIIPNFSLWIHRSFFSLEAIFNLFKSVAKLVIIIWVGYLNLKKNLNILSNLSETPILEGVSFISSIIVKIFLESFLVLLFFAGLDYLFQRKVFLDSLRMSKQEIKEEKRQSEGDPLLKNRLKDRMRQILSQNVKITVPKADVIITNPTHYAIALEWDGSRMIAPQVIAKGLDSLALSIIEIAKDHNVPRVENPPLARALYASVDIGDGVPPEYWELVSRILAEIYALNQKVKL